MKGNDIIKKLHKREGVALIITVGILALLVIFGMVFAITARLELLTAKNYLNSVKAKYLAQAGINHAIAELKNDARSNFAYDDNVSISEGQSLGEGTYTVKIEDEARKVNINNANSNLLRNLPDLNATLANNIISVRSFETKEEIKTATGIGETKYNNIKDYITITSWEDPACSSRSPININTTSEDVLKAVLAGTGISSAYVDTAYTAINSSRPFFSWDDFNDCIDSTSLDASAKQIIKNNANPNRTKPAQYTTEFCFHSGGHYSIVSTGEAWGNGVRVSEKKLKTIVKIYDVWNQTTKEQFRGDVDVDGDGVYEPADGDIDFNDDNKVDDVPEYARITWLDNCPVNIDDCWQSTYVSSNADTVDGSLKIGYWDDFSEDSAYSSAQWAARQNPFDGYKDDYAIEDGELKTRRASEKESDPSKDVWPIIDLGEAIEHGATGDAFSRRWQWKSISLKAHMIDEHGNPSNKNRDDIPWHSVPAYWLFELCSQRMQKWQDVGQILFLKALTGSEETYPCSNAVYATRPDPCTEAPTPVDISVPLDGVIDEYHYTCGLILTAEQHDVGVEMVCNGVTTTVKVRHDGEEPYNLQCDYVDNHSDSVLGLFGIHNYGDEKPTDLPTDRISSTYQYDKNFHFYVCTYHEIGTEDILFSGKIHPESAVLTAQPGGGWGGFYNKKGPGIVCFYGQSNLPDLDTIRIISHDGYYISYPLDFGSAPHEWGTIFWTMTTPDTVKASEPENEQVKVSFELQTGTDTNFGNYNTWIQGRTGDITSSGGSIGTNYTKTTDNHQYLKFKVFLECTDDDDGTNYLKRLSETPVLEDVWITYLPKTRILYYTEVEN